MQGGEKFLHSFIDLLLSITIFFIITTVFFLIGFVKNFEKENNYYKDKDLYFKKYVSVLYKYNHIKFKFIDDIFNNLDIGKDRVIVHSSYIEIIFVENENINFDVGKYVIKNTETEIKAIDSFVNIIKNVCEYNEKFSNISAENSKIIEEVIIEGHSDVSKNLAGIGCSQSNFFKMKNVAEETFSFCNNIRLSSERAQEIYFLVRDRIIDPKLRACYDNLTSVTGRGPVKPYHKANFLNERVWKNEFDTFNVIDQDRRVVLKIKFYVPELKLDETIKFYGRSLDGLRP